MILYYLLKRDLYLRFRDTMKMSTFLILLYTAIVFYCTWNQLTAMNERHVSLSINFYKIFSGVDFINLAHFYKEGRLTFPFYWLFFQLIPLLALGHFTHSDIQKNGVYLLPRVRKKSLLWSSKMISLFVYTFVLWIVMYVIWFTLYFSLINVLGSSSMSNNLFLSNILYTMAIQIIISYILCLIYELFTLYMPSIIALSCLVTYLVGSVFIHSHYLLGSFVMPGRWYFVDHSPIQLTASHSHSIQYNEFFLVSFITFILILIVSFLSFKKLDVIGD
ncbi:hypothetical protein ACTFRN_09420 [Bacillus cereus group sp. MYBK245-2]|uniref:ABC-2 family transporter protein n=2 Tax=Bacillus cereus group TaxID=86661 RepID=A0A1Y5ZI36_9BACI|nr:hypothetical protein BKK40_27785 [Bacillus cereus]SMD93926.1 ABC-2 family transporter protein [Bacillus pacificus]